MKWIFILIVFSGLASFAEETPSSFLDGIAAYKLKDYSKAQEIFTPLLQEHPTNPSLLYNLGLTEYQLGRMGLALGLWRKARFLNADFTPAIEAIEFTEEQLFPDKSNKTFIVAIFDTLKGFPFWIWGLLTIGSFLVSGWWCLDYGVKRKFPMSLWPAWIFFSIPLFLLSSIFTTYLYFENTQAMATVVTKNQVTRVNPSDTSPTLSELAEGQVVQVERIYGPWAQVRTQVGAPGWVPQNSIIIFKGK